MTSGFGASGLLVLLVVWLIDTFQWRATYIFLGLGIWLLGIPLSIIIRDNAEQYGSTPDGDLAVNDCSNLLFEDPELDFAAVIKRREFWQIGTAEFIRMVVVSGVITHIMPYLATINMSRFGCIKHQWSSLAEHSESCGVRLAG